MKICKLCGDKTNNKFNINLSPVPICEICACDIAFQQLESLIINSKKLEKYVQKVEHPKINKLKK